MSDNIIYEISRLINDKSALRSDMNDAAVLVAEMFKKKYLNRLSERVVEHRKSLTKNPPKEIKLINALKEFMPEEERQKADSVIETFIIANTFAKIRNETAAVTGGDIRQGLVTPASVGEPEHIHIQEAAPAYQPGAPAQEAESSVHADGVYDLDVNCLKKKSKNEMAGMLMVMAMMMK